MTIEQFAQLIQEYESDTFSAEGSDIKKWEAELVAQRIIRDWVADLLDGVTIDSALEEVREEILKPE